MDAIVEKISQASLANLKEMAAMLYNDDREEVDIILPAVLSQLSTLMPEAEFVSFCEGL